MKKIIVLLAILVLGFLSVSAQNTVKYASNKEKSFITYSMTHPLHEWEGTSKNVNSVLVFNTTTKLIEKVAAALPVSTFDSQNANRDSHMIEVVEGIKFPTITFSSTSITGTLDKMSVSGNITFHGVSVPIVFEASGKITENGIEVIGAFNLKISDFKIENPSLLGIPTKDIILLKFLGVYNPK